MAQDTKYTSKSLILRSKGLVARNVPDQPPDISYFLNMDGAQEREENAISTRWGQTIINRSPDGTSGGTNYSLPAVPVILSRLRSLNGQTYRYAALADGSLWRRAADTQGPYTQIATGLSGQKFTALTQTCFETAQPYLFCYDPLNPIKDSGTGTPSRIGIVPPRRPHHGPAVRTADCIDRQFPVHIWVWRLRLPLHRCDCRWHRWHPATFRQL